MDVQILELGDPPVSHVLTERRNILGQLADRVAIDPFCCCDSTCQYAAGQGANVVQGYCIKTEGVPNSGPGCVLCSELNLIVLVSGLNVEFGICTWSVGSIAVRPCGEGPFVGTGWELQLRQNVLELLIRYEEPGPPQVFYKAAFRMPFTGKLDMLNFGEYTIPFSAQWAVFEGDGLFGCDMSGATVRMVPQPQVPPFACSEALFT